ncbi:ElaA protein [Halanaerobium saccharolyticum]|uniref:ElaA protein n=1 Tax=Halanaerobium saccharolyticum TaxID=43595 RepID=A0A4R7YQI8_9FIRM|nr:GNAT family N-acetyltransferase [Halanaerobium saccharolyticum]RAK05188.1 ElaA protein [Halanaerobium saccharolyticum]TDV99019.1 ElaA protein [Halanaerobium saccharolyticum]TDX51710.1 ElaA protein [Halanaerobium saccharolyticum]
MELNIKSFSELNNQELYKIIEARINVFVVEQNCPYQECDNKDQDSFHLFYQDQNRIAAYLRIIPPGISYQEASIGRVLVKKEYRREGLGIKMMEAAVAFINNNFNTEVIRISAQEYILKFYQDLGFKVVSDRYLEDNIPHYQMLYKL